MKTLIQKASVVLTSVVLGVSGAAASAWASGFALSEQSVKGLGSAFANGATEAEDATAIFFNPAGLTQFSQTSIVLGNYLIAPQTQFTNQGSTDITRAPLRGGNGGNDATANKIIPNFFAAWSLSDRVKAGIGVNIPFALVTEYQDNWVGRYQALKSELLTININPTIAAKLTDDLSVGAGLNVQYARADLSNAIDFGTIGRRVGLPTVPQGADGRLNVSGDDWSVGYKLGLMYTPSPNTRVGLAYRSGISHDLKGNADFTVPNTVSALTRGGQFRNTTASASLKLPDTISLSAYQKVNPQVALVGDVTWTHWSRFKELRIDFDNPAQPDAVQPENWKDTVRVGLGVHYTVNPALTLRAGVAYDPTPVRDEFRTPRIPDQDRTWLAVGASYRVSNSLTVDIGYAHLFVKNGSIDQVGTTGDRLVGNYDSHVDIVGVQAALSF